MTGSYDSQNLNTVPQHKGSGNRRYMQQGHSARGNNINQQYVQQGASVVQQQPQQVQIIERVIEKEKKNGGFPNPFKPLFAILDIFSRLRQLFITGCFIVFFVLVALILILLIRPPFLWNPIKAFLNSGIRPPEVLEIPVEEIYQSINRQAGDMLFAELDESEVTILFRKKVQTEHDVRIDVEEDMFRILVNMDMEDRPLWMVTEAEVGDGKLAVTKVGFERFGLPGGINSFLSDQLFNILTLTRNQIAGNSIASLFNIIIDPSNLEADVEIKRVFLDEDTVRIQFSSNVEGQF